MKRTVAAALFVLAAAAACSNGGTSSQGDADPAAFEAKSQLTVLLTRRDELFTEAGDWQKKGNTASDAQDFAAARYNFGNAARTYATAATAMIDGLNKITFPATAKPAAGRLVAAEQEALSTLQQFDAITSQPQFDTWNQARTAVASAVASAEVDLGKALGMKTTPFGISG
jgi:hypothetical protein